MIISIFFMARALRHFCFFGQLASPHAPAEADKGNPGDYPAGVSMMLLAMDEKHDLCQEFRRLTGESLGVAAGSMGADDRS
jgi:hypothetical protein